MDKEKLTGYLNIARKGNNLIIGSDRLRDYNKKIYLLLYDNSSKNNTLKIVKSFKSKEIETIMIENLEEYIKIRNCKILGIKNKALSDIISGILKGENFGKSRITKSKENSWPSEGGRNF